MNHIADEPQYVTLYHAIDWIAGLVDRPSPIFNHKNIESRHSTKYSEQDLFALRRSAMEKIVDGIYSKKLRIFLKDFSAIFSQGFSSVANEPHTSLDYPWYIWSDATKLVTKLPSTDFELEIDNDQIEIVWSPISYGFVDRYMNSNYEFDGLGASFSYMEQFEEEFYVLTKHGLIIRHAEPSYFNNNPLVLVFLKVSEIKNLNDFSLVAQIEGRPQMHHSEVSLLAYLNERINDLDMQSQDNYSNFLKSIDFDQFVMNLKKAKGKKKSVLIEQKFPGPNSLGNLLQQLDDHEVEYIKLLDVQHKVFTNWIVDKEIGSLRTLQKHFNEIKAELEKK